MLLTPKKLKKMVAVNLNITACVFYKPFEYISQALSVNFYQYSLQFVKLFLVA
jgi:hypothetical protein